MKANMIEKLGNRALLAPIMVAIVIGIVFGTALAPILSATPRNLPVAICNVDKGAQTPLGTVNMGDKVAEGIMESATASAEKEDGDPVVKIKEVETLNQLNKAMDQKKYYASIVIPEGFTASALAAQQGAGSPEAIKVTINVGKNPMVATVLSQQFGSIAQETGLAVEIDKINDADVAGGSMAPMMMVQFLVLPLIIMTIIGAALLVVMGRKLAPKGRRGKARIGAVQAGVTVLASALNAITVICVELIAGIQLPVAEAFLFLWLADLALLLCLLGIMSLSLPVGVVLALCMFALGMCTAILPAEMLPTFWTDFVAPWAPQYYLGEGLRAVIYFDANVFNAGLSAFMVYALIGVVGLAASVALPDEPKAKKAA